MNTYFGLRDYQTPGQMGLEATPEEWVQGMVEVFREVRRVLRPDGTLWLNIGDSYATGTTAPRTHSPNSIVLGTGYADAQDAVPRVGTPAGMKAKDLMGIPWMLAFALRADGWYLRSEITWCKRACMPESVTDRPTTATEKIFLLSKQARYFYDSEAVREEVSASSDFGKDRPVIPMPSGSGDAANDQRIHARLGNGSVGNPSGRNMRNFWLLGPEPFSEAHFATFVTEIPRRAILAGTSEKGCCPECGAPWVRVVESSINHTQRVHNGVYDQSSGFGKSGWLPGQKQVDTLGWRPSCAHTGEPVPATVLDPFFGAGTTGLVADRLNRNCIGIEINPTYADMARRRISNDAPLFAGVPYQPPVKVVDKQGQVGNRTYTGFNARWDAKEDSA